MLMQDSAVQWCPHLFHVHLWAGRRRNLLAAWQGPVSIFLSSSDVLPRVVVSFPLGRIGTLLGSQEDNQAEGYLHSYTACYLAAMGCR